MKNTLIRSTALALCAVIALVIFGAIRTPAAAQDGNLLQDPGFEGAYSGRGRGDLNTAAPWNLFNQDGPRGPEWALRADKVFAFPHRGGPEVKSGTLSQNINGGYVTFAVAIYQTVNVPANTAINGSIWARIKTCNIGAGADNCGSAVESGAYVKVGIDPTGGTNPYASTVAWSPNIAPHDTYLQASVTVRTTGPTATMFAFFTQASPSVLNNVWFDDAYLGTGGPGGTVAAGVPAAPVIPPTPIPPTAFVAIRQAVRPDGSQWHFVQPGDTLTGISSAYGVTIDEIMTLNELRSSRFIFFNQELVIRPAGGSAPTRVGGATARPTLPIATLNATDQAWLNRNTGSVGPTPVGVGG
ncbi:MAG: LysM domain-containing protein [Chloroflexota bacterium]|nr:LysM domain-containing protein [Chloroflexota bacterium]